MRGRGDDFPSVIHEWGGRTSAALLCCQALTGQDPLTESTYLLAPKHRTALTWQLRGAGARLQTQPLAWFQLANLEVFAADLARCLGRDLRWQLTEIPADDSGIRSIRVCSPHAEITIPLQAFLDGCFGAAAFDAQINALNALTPLFSEDEEIPLPLPFFISGLESI
jgi:hypothetical protein